MSNHYGQPPPPYPYQQQEPIQGHHSGDYASYPQLNQQQQQQQADQRWGTPVMGAPSNPSAHPDNQHAAAGSFGGANRQNSGSFHDQVQAAQAQTAPSNNGQVPNQGQDPYVQSSSTSTTPGKGGGSMDKIKAQVAEYSTQAQEVMNRVWGHLSTGPSMADTAWGRVTAGTQLLRQGGFEGVFKATFTPAPDEKLKKTYACFLSTSTGPVGGTLYISNKKLAFCSDRPLSYTPEGGQQSYSYYKVIVPVDRVGAVNPSVNQSKPNEKYIQIVTKDNFEFWFMGFVNYDKGVKNLQAVLIPENQPVGGSTQQQGSAQQPYPLNQQTYPPNQQTYPPNQQSQQTYTPPNQYGTPTR